MIPSKLVHDSRDMIDYMWSLSEEIYEGKKKAFAEGDEAVRYQIGRGKDIISILSAFSLLSVSRRFLVDIGHSIVKGNLNNGENQLDEKEIIAQVGVISV
jgi:hypothetical protein